MDQSADIVQNLRDMVIQFVSQENALILAVTAGNVDIANSDALSIAKEVDPNGERTIGVLTKLDLEDKGTNSMDVLMGRIYPLKLGYIGVVNRSQQDINNGVNVQTSLRNEKQFFETHSIYKSIADRMGTEYMVNRLNILLLEHIQKCLPGLKRTIQEQFEKAKKRYDLIRPDDDNIMSLSLQQIMKFVAAFTSAINGTDTDIHTHELAGGAKIFSVFEKIFRPSIDQLDILAGIKDVDILTAIKNASGTRPCLYVPQSAFEMLISKQVRSFEGTCHNCVDTVYNEMKSIVTKTARDHIVKYDRFREALIQAATEVMNEYMSQTHKMVQDLIDIEADYVNTSHPDFSTSKILKEVDEAAKVPEGKQKQQSPQPETPTQETSRPKQSHFGGALGKQSSATATPTTQSTDKATMIKVDHNNHREVKEISLIRNLCKSYLVIVRKSINDMVPKAVIHFLVFKTRDSIQKELIRKLYNEKTLEELLAENPAIVNERKVIKQNMDALKRALDIINDVREQTINY